MKNLTIWIIALLTAIVLILGIVYYKIFSFVENVTSFIISLTIIFLIIILLIVFSNKNNKR